MSKKLTTLKELYSRHKRKSKEERRESRYYFYLNIIMIIVCSPTLLKRGIIKMGKIYTGILIALIAAMLYCIFYIK